MGEKGNCNRQFDMNIIRTRNITCYTHSGIIATGSWERDIKKRIHQIFPQHTMSWITHSSFWFPHFLAQASAVVVFTRMPFFIILNHFSCAFDRRWILPCHLPSPGSIIPNICPPSYARVKSSISFLLLFFLGFFLPHSLAICRTVFLSTSMSVYPLVCLSVPLYLSLCLSVSLSLCLFLTFSVGLIYFLQDELLHVIHEWFKLFVSFGFDSNRPERKSQEQLHEHSWQNEIEGNIDGQKCL